MHNPRFLNGMKSATELFIPQAAVSPNRSIPVELLLLTETFERVLLLLSGWSTMELKLS